MNIQWLRIRNFRQFYGDQELRFASGGDKNVSIVFGANGAGKTTLLSAFTWCLYQRPAPGLESPERMINERAWSEAKDGVEVEAKVTIRFKHDDGNTYEVERVQVHRKEQGQALVVRDGGPHDLRVTVTDSNGASRPPVGNPNDMIQQILPFELHRYFFFDGERMDELVKKQESKAKEKERERLFAEATKKLLGLELIERAIDHVKIARGQLDKELSAALPKGVQAEVQAIEARIEAKVAALEEKEENLIEQRRNLVALAEESEEVDAALRLNERSRELQERRDAYEQQRESIDQQLRNVTNRQKTLIGRSGYLAFTADLTKQVTERANQVRERGQIPTPIKRQFVEDLLAEARCICGAVLEPGTAAHRAVEEWRARAVAAGAEAAWVKLGGQTAQFDLDRAALFEDLSDCVNERDQLLVTRADITDRISELQTLLAGVDSAEIQGLATRQAELAEQIAETNRRIGGLETDIDVSKRSIEEAEKERREKTSKIGQAETAQRRFEAAIAVERFFADLLAVKIDDTRKALHDKINLIYSGISYKDYVPELSREFQLTLHKKIGSAVEPVAKSTGENQILSLSFVGAIAAHARQLVADGRQQLPILAGFGGGIYPIVMDSPFGALDEGYREQIAKAIPTLAEQVIVFVSKSQGLGVVFRELSPRIGCRYVIEYQTTKADVAPEIIDLDGQQYSYIAPASEPFEWAKIQEV